MRAYHFTHGAYHATVYTTPGRAYLFSSHACDRQNHRLLRGRAASILALWRKLVNTAPRVYSLQREAPAAR